MLRGQGRDRVFIAVGRLPGDLPEQIEKAVDSQDLEIVEVEATPRREGFLVLHGAATTGVAR